MSLSTDFTVMLSYLSNFLSAQSADEDDQYDFTDGRNFILTNKDNIAEQGQERHVSKLQENMQTNKLHLSGQQAPFIRLI